MFDELKVLINDYSNHFNALFFLLIIINCYLGDFSPSILCNIITFIGLCYFVYYMINIYLYYHPRKNNNVVNKKNDSKK